MINTFRKNHFQKCATLIWLAFFSILIMLGAPLIGVSQLSWSEVFQRVSENRDAMIFWQIRIPRVLVAFLAGATFALSGMVFQALFRNPLVSPFTLGVSAGASFGAALSIWLGITFTFFGITSISVFSFFGAVFSIVCVWFLAKIKKGSSISTMLLAGVAVSFFFASFIMFIQYLSDINQAAQITRWIMGGLFVFGYEQVLNILPFTMIGFGVIWFFTNELNLFTTGEEMAQSRGVHVDGMVRILFFLISLMIGGVVAVCGPIAFVGIVAPHICRLLFGSNHLYLTPATFLFGGSFLVVCDAVSRTVLAPAEIPLGVITALIGGPFFLWILITRSGEDII
ncbi:MAG: iron ABC transporter permease [Candidatus Omnitrophica bacterium]|nr:iron ABC transporter permease [Candidatus Omnitrophota bacterium]